ncbi:BREX-1 system adenine-specific DNA-methyltransferase PglX, partial [cf. Phormidesmis sp. LEGE 11477]|uniref:BREX-1 system adenine-specific DNA-methyltransferase PglX n=1 Tax=cf. Phormidesmis sp. LEGE 11477 TaxID=1828680 RepID=UPI001881C231
MDTATLKKFAQAARRQLMAQVKTKLGVVLAEGSAARRERLAVVEKLEGQIAQKGEAQVIDQVAYTWFNRFCALRYMDVKRYTRVGVVSAAAGQLQPEILAEAKLGQVDEKVPTPVKQQILGLLDGSVPSVDGQVEAYRLLIVATCNDFHRVMPYLFERIDDYTELLMPDDLLSQSSVLAQTRAAMTEDNCENVEVIGWLYQFYISEKKDEVFAGLKKNKKITPENIPAATQLFTPHWIVRYLVENSLGRLWLLNRPGSGLKAQMDYYIEPEQAETDFLQVGSPEELKICDPACGSGHMLTYAFDLLYAIYEEEGYAPEEIPGKILTCNLYGIEIDQRAGALAAFALTMKARERQRRFFRKGVGPNICVLENVRFEEGELDEYMDFVERDLFTISSLETIKQFEKADNFGSLIRPMTRGTEDIAEKLKGKNVEGKLLLYKTHRKVLTALEQTDYLSSKYHVVIANPPYMGSKGMNKLLGGWLKDNFPHTKSDLFAAFIERNRQLVLEHGYVAMITMQTWMFLSSFKKARITLLSEDSIVSLIQIGYNSFPELNSKIAQACAFVIANKSANETGIFMNLNDTAQSADKNSVFLKKKNDREFFCVSSIDFKDIPGSPVAYWVSKKVLGTFRFKKLGDISDVKGGMSTSDNPKFLRYWPEVSLSNSALNVSKEVALSSECRWFVYNKGGALRKWFGNGEFLVNWKNDGEDIKYAVVNNPQDPNTTHWSRRIFNTDYFFEECITWGDINSSLFTARFLSKGAISDSVGIGAYRISDISTGFGVLALLNSKIFPIFAEVLCPTLHFNSGPMSNLPIPNEFPPVDFQKHRVERLVNLATRDWNSYEVSWDFSQTPLLGLSDEQKTLKDSYQLLRADWHQHVLDTQSLEIENNKILSYSYGLESEVSTEVPLKEITLTCN